MLRSLFSGVAGLQSHQYAMDVESNNIANINTVGYKYSRASFADLVSQTNQIATAPQEKMGGQNPIQVGLGSRINATTRIFSQGSLQTTDKNTDLGIQGDGFFIVSPDEGDTLKYTRNGDFKFDADGNFVDNNGFKIQGWVRDHSANKLDITRPIEEIMIKPGLTAPADPTSHIDLKANLNSGNKVKSTKEIYTSKEIANGAKPDDFEVLFGPAGRALNLQSAKPAESSNVLIGGDGVKISSGGPYGTFAEFRYIDNPANVDAQDSDGNNVYYFNTTEDYANALQHWLRNNPNNPNRSETIKVDISDIGRFHVTNEEDEGAVPLKIHVEGLHDVNTSENILFRQIMQSLTGNLDLNTDRSSQSIKVATHTASIDIFDSLGSKHTVTIKFRKDAITKDGGVSWMYDVEMPFPSELDGGGTVLKDNQIIFASDGSLLTNTRTRFSFTTNNGSEPNQEVQLNFGELGSFNGVSSFDKESATAGISQDGYPGGDLIGMRIDNSGNIMGSFSNGHSLALAQVALARFPNNEGLRSEGGNIFSQTGNSGDAIVGPAASGGRGFIQSASLEGSNVSLSRSLTQLIIIQRGFQANSKVIATSDTLLETLIGLKR